jgi:hypothetical protein
MFRTLFERDKAMRELAKQRGINPKDEAAMRKMFEYGNTKESIFQKLGSEGSLIGSLMKKISDFELKGGTDKELKAQQEMFKDSLYQIYLQRLPEANIRKNLIHSKGIAGFSEDPMQMFRETSTRTAGQLTGIKFGPKAERAIDEIREFLRPKDESDTGISMNLTAKYETAAAVLASRLREAIFPPKSNEFVTAANQVAFVTYLTSAASAVTNFTNIPMRLVPHLAPQFGYAKTHAVLLDMAKLYNSVGMTGVDRDGNLHIAPPSMEHSAMVRSDPDMQFGYNYGKGKSAFETPQATVLRSSNETRLGRVTSAVTNALSLPFMASERLVREVGFMAPYKLKLAELKKAGKGTLQEQREAAGEFAMKALDHSMGDFSDYQRSSLFRHPAGKLLFLFKSFTANTTSFFLRTGLKILGQTKGLSKQERLQAAHELAGVLVMGAVFSGIAGLPLFTITTNAIDLIQKLDDDETKAERRLRYPGFADSSAARFKYGFMREHFGPNTIPATDGWNHPLSDILLNGPVSALTGANIASRTAYDGMWLREGKKGDSMGADIWNFVMANIPAVSMTKNMGDGVTDIQQGNVLRGLEKMVPGAAKGWITAERMKENQGVETPEGDQLFSSDELPENAAILTRMGFQLHDVANVQNYEFDTNNNLKDIENQKNQIVRQFVGVALDETPSPGQLEKVYKQAQAFDDKYPWMKMQVTLNTLMDAVEKGTLKKEQTIHGMRFHDAEDEAYLAPGLPLPKKVLDKEAGVQ